MSKSYLNWRREQKFLVDDITLFPEKRQGTFMRAGAFIRINTVCLQNLGPVVQSIVSLTSSLRGHLVQCFATS